METIQLQVNGMKCEHCVKTVTEALNALAGVSASVSLDQAKATIQTTAPIKHSQLIKAVESAGFSAQLID